MKHLFGILALMAFTGAVPAQTVVVGTGNPDIDIAAVQAAVDRGGSVLLRGRFSFDNPPSRRGELTELMATVLVSKAVSISGTLDEHGEMTAILGGEIPFAVEAHRAEVRIERLRFIRPRHFAIFADAVSGLAIESCSIELVEPPAASGEPAEKGFRAGIIVSPMMGLPSSERPGTPSHISGKLSILDNQISLDGAGSESMGIMIVNVGVPDNPVDVAVSANTIRNSNMFGINLKQIGGRARIERNTVITSGVNSSATRGLNAGIHCGGLGLYEIARNIVNVADPNGTGIRLRGFIPLGAAIEHATVADNDVTMSMPDGALPGVHNAGIEIIGLARGTIARRNRIQGRARVGLSVVPDMSGIPVGSSFDQNDEKSLHRARMEGGRGK